jgi:hypothetical protein
MTRPGGSDDGWPDRLTNYHLPFQAALAQIMPRRRHLTLADAIGIVDAECDKWGVHPSREAVDWLARAALDPYRHFKHPIRAHREGWRWSWRGGWRRP